MKSVFRLRSLLSLSLSIILVSGLLAACGSSKDSQNSTNAPKATNSSASGTDTPKTAKIKIVAAENFYGEVAIAVGGDQVEVTSILNNPETDPHDFEPTPEASKAVHDAKVIIYNGIGYDEWMKKLVDASGDTANKTLIAVGSDVAGKKEGDNEHVWYNPETMPGYAKLLADKLGKLDPAHSDQYKKQADTYIASLTGFTNLVKELNQASPLPIAVSEPVFDYMANALNLNVTDKKFEMAAEEETDPAPADVAQLQNDIKEKKIKMFINNIQASSTTVKNMVDLAKKSELPVIEVTETLPAGKNYSQWMIDQLNQIKAVLK